MLSTKNYPPVKKVQCEEFYPWLHTMRTWETVLFFVVNPSQEALDLFEETKVRGGMYHLMEVEPPSMKLMKNINKNEVEPKSRLEQDLNLLFYFYGKAPLHITSAFREAICVGGVEEVVLTSFGFNSKKCIIACEKKCVEKLFLKILDYNGKITRSEALGFVDLQDLEHLVKKGLLYLKYKNNVSENTYEFASAQVMHSVRLTLKEKITDKQIALLKLQHELKDEVSSE
eukprot:gb/GECH01006346.1/.p1 GENE.gb/GECH01006346.1/~~gb/GECH01006346.1/.p1  ORF type:complete len:229 (+),score=18.92 gb/GECH01006346.1/:1-687(+)